MPSRGGGTRQTRERIIGQIPICFDPDETGRDRQGARAVPLVRRRLEGQLRTARPGRIRRRDPVRPAGGRGRVDPVWTGRRNGSWNRSRRSGRPVSPTSRWSRSAASTSASSSTSRSPNCLPALRSASRVARSMARPIWSGSITFGLVTIPVALFSATEDHTIHFNQFERGTSDRIRYQRVNERTGKEVDYADIVRGHQIDDGEYVVVESDELADIAPGRSRSIEVTTFVDLAAIDPIYFQKTYWLAPAETGLRRFLRAAGRRDGQDEPGRHRHVRHAWQGVPDRGARRRGRARAGHVVLRRRDPRPAPAGQPAGQEEGQGQAAGHGGVADRGDERAVAARGVRGHLRGQGAQADQGQAQGQRHHQRGRAARGDRGGRPDGGVAAQRRGRAQIARCQEEHHQGEHQEVARPRQGQQVRTGRTGQEAQDQGPFQDEPGRAAPVGEARAKAS